LKEVKIEESLALAHTIVDTLEQKKGEDIVLIDLSELQAFTDYFVICSGPSERTLKALADEVQKQVKQNYQIRAVSIEGEPDAGWILLDYGSVILHIFSPAVRAYYKLEELWREGPVLLRIQ
jgi:ribosome-associated protein